MTPVLVSGLWDKFWLLTPHQRVIVRLIYSDRLTQADVAAELGINQSSVHRALKSAERRIEKNIRGSALNGHRKRLVHVETADEGAERGNGQRPDTSLAPACQGPPASLCPQPDTYYETPERDAFVKELSWCAAAPFLQLQNRGGYNRRARENRDRIARDREAAEAERRALRAA
jgi:predicted DNA-binding protein YlxM (UPF0122 family)